MYNIFLAFFPLTLEIIHTPHEQVYSGEPLTISAEVSEEVPAAYLIINETPVYMEKDNKKFSTVIQGELVVPPYLKYRIAVKTRDNRVIQSPDYKIPVIEKKELIELISPEPYGTVSNRKPDIIITFNKEKSSSDIIILLDGIDITKNCEITPYSVYYKPTKDFSIGEHNLKITIKNVTEATYTFSIISKKYAHGYISGGVQYGYGNGYEDYFPYKPGFLFPFDMCANGSFYFPFYLWAYYEETTNFNLEFELPALKLSIGDVYPAGSLLTLYAASPRGIQLNITSLPVNIELLGGEIEHIDTSFYVDTLIDTLYVDSFVVGIDTLVDTTISGNYTRYILGGKIDWNLWKAKMGICYYYGFDDSSSMNVDSNLVSTALIDAPMWNYFIAGNLEYPLFNVLSIGGEYCVSNTHNNPYYETQKPVGSAYDIFLNYESRFIGTKLTYNKIDKSYYTTGNPYLDAGKEGFLLELSSSYKGAYYNSTYEIYELDDSIEYYLYSSINYTIWKFSPYITHSLLGNSQTLTLGNRFNFNKGNILLSYGLGSNSNSIRGDFEYELFKNKLDVRGGYGRSETKDSLGTVNQNPDFAIDFMDRISIEYKGMFNKDYSDSKYDYNENIFTFKLKQRF